MYKVKMRRIENFEQYNARLRTLRTQQNNVT